MEGFFLLKELLMSGNLMLKIDLKDTFLQFRWQKALNSV